jgi:hypothetical protein
MSFYNTAYCMNQQAKAAKRNSVQGSDTTMLIKET